LKDFEDNRITVDESGTAASTPDWQVKGNTQKLGGDWMYIADDFADIPRELISVYSNTFKNQHPPFAAVYPVVKGKFFKKSMPFLICLDTINIYFLDSAGARIYKLSNVDYIEQTGILLCSEIKFYFNDDTDYSVAYNTANQNIIDFIKGKIRDTVNAPKGHHINYFDELEVKSYYMMNRANEVLENYDGPVTYIYKYPKRKKNTEILIVLTKTEIIHFTNEKAPFTPLAKVKTKYIPIKNVSSIEKDGNIFIIEIRGNEKIEADISNVDERSVDEFIKCFQMHKDITQVLSNIHAEH